MFLRSVSDASFLCRPARYKNDPEGLSNMPVASIHHSDAVVIAVIAARHRLPPLTWPKFLSDVAYRFLTCVENAQGQETTATTSHSPWAGTCYKQKRQSFLFFPPDEFGFDTIREQKPRGRLRTSVGNQTLPRVYSLQARRHCSAINASDGREACRNTRLVFG